MGLLRLAFVQEVEEDYGGNNRGRVRGVWPHSIGGQDWHHVFKAAVNTV